jgi:hypothetical protein
VVLDVQLWILCGHTHRFVLCACRKEEGWRERHVAPQGASGEVTKPKPKPKTTGHADMRLTCGSHVSCGMRWGWRGGGWWWHLQLQLLFAARGPPEPESSKLTSSEPRRGRGIVFRNSRISLSAGRRACEPAAKPAIPGVILLHNGFVWPERTRVPSSVVWRSSREGNVP